MVVGTFATELQTIVIGSGPGGYVAAIRAAQLGQKVGIIEKESIGGVCLNVGCIPSKALINAGHAYTSPNHVSEMGINVENVTLDFTKLQEWKDNKVVKKLTSGIAMLLKKNKVEIIHGEATIVDDNSLRVISGDEGSLYNFENLILATGSRPLEIPGFKFNGRVLDSTGLLNIKELPKSLLVIGGGYIGCELATAFANLGSKVTILEASQEILPSFDSDMVKLVKDTFKKLNIQVITNAFAKNSQQNDANVIVDYEVNGEKSQITSDYVMVSVGRKPNTDNIGLQNTSVRTDDRGLIIVNDEGRTNVKNIFAIGDIVAGLPLAHKASYEGKIAAEVISGKNVKVDYIAMPSVCYTDPELASVGITKREAKEKNINIIEAVFPFAANGRALSLGDTRGFVKLISEKESGILIGAEVAGIGASDLIAELSLAIECQLTIEDIALTIHAHPTLAEAIMDAAEVGLGLPIHI